MNNAREKDISYRGEDFEILAAVMWYSVLEIAVGGNDLESLGPAPQFKTLWSHFILVHVYL